MVEGTDISNPPVVLSTLGSVTVAPYSSTGRVAEEAKASKEVQAFKVVETTQSPCNK